jgi:hypothetical protein
MIAVVRRRRELDVLVTEGDAEGELGRTVNSYGFGAQVNR